MAYPWQCRMSWCHVNYMYNIASYTQFIITTSKIHPQYVQTTPTWHILFTSKQHITLQQRYYYQYLTNFHFQDLKLDPIRPLIISIDTVNKNHVSLTFSPTLGKFLIINITKHLTLYNTIQHQISHPHPPTYFLLLFTSYIRYTFTSSPSFFCF